MKNRNKDQENLNPKGRGLGRGLDALFGDEEVTFAARENNDDVNDNDGDADDDIELSGSRKTIGIEKLYPCPTQPRKYFDDELIKKLAISIVEHGLLQPILVRPDSERNGYYEIIAGERRWRAAQQAQLHDVPVVIREMDDETMFQISLVENLQRQDLSAIEEARGYQRLVDEFDNSHSEIGKILGRSRSHIANMIRLLDLPDSVQTMVDVGDLTMGHARALIGQDKAFDLALYVIENNLSVRDTEKYIAEFQGRDIKKRGSSKSGKQGFAQKDADTLALEKEVSDQIGMNVSIDMANEAKGKMTINFRTLDQLDDILQRLAQTPQKKY